MDFLDNPIKVELSGMKPVPRYICCVTGNAKYTSELNDYVEDPDYWWTVKEMDTSSIPKQVNIQYILKKT